MEIRAFACWPSIYLRGEKEEENPTWGKIEDEKTRNAIVLGIKFESNNPLLAHPVGRGHENTPPIGIVPGENASPNPGIVANSPYCRAKEKRRMKIRALPNFPS